MDKEALRVERARKRQKKFITIVALSMSIVCTLTVLFITYQKWKAGVGLNVLIILSLAFLIPMYIFSWLYYRYSPKYYKFDVDQWDPEGDGGDGKDRSYSWLVILCLVTLAVVAIVLFIVFYMKMYLLGLVISILNTVVFMYYFRGHRDK